VVERDGWMGGTAAGSDGGAASGSGSGSGSGSWRPLETVEWEGALDAGRSSCVVSGAGGVSPLVSLSPVWRVLLLSDGSMTRHLNALLSCGPLARGDAPEDGIGVDVIAQEPIGESLAGLPPAVQLIRGPRVQRQVWLTDGGGDAGGEGDGGMEGEGEGEGEGGRAGRRRLVYACSWWNQSEIEEYLKEKGTPMWASLQDKHVELYREVRKLYLGRAPGLAADLLLGAKGNDGRDHAGLAAQGVAPALWARHYVFYLGGRPLTVVYECFSPRLAEIAGPQRTTD